MILPAQARAAVDTICAHYGFSFDEILEQKRNAERTSAKRALVIFLREHAGWSFPRIARYMQRDHTTVIHHYERAGEGIKKTAELFAAAFKASGGPSVCPACKQPIKKN